MSLRWEKVACTPAGEDIGAVALDNGRGLTARVMSYGATLLALRTADRFGRSTDLVLGFDDAGAYFQAHPYFGCIVGRYANRIAGARFTLGRTEYVLAANHGRHHLHGGLCGFDKVVWKLIDEQADPPRVTWRYYSPAGEEGYPGNLSVDVTYSLTESNALRLDYEARTDAPTVFNPTHHAYWNLGATEDILDHELQVLGSRFLPVDRDLIPTGEQRPVSSTAMNFLTSAQIGSRIDPNDPQIRHANGGYDHTWVLDRCGAGLVLGARLYAPDTGIGMEVLTTEPGLQLYTGNLLDRGLDGGLVGKSGRRYDKFAGLCLETQHFPDSPHWPEFPSTVLQPGQTYRQTTVYRFFIRR